MLLSGSPPFYGKSVEDVYNSILTKDASFADKKFKHVSNSCMDFMKRLLVRDARYRISINEALNHPFITGATFFPRYSNVLPSARSTDMMDVDSGNPKLSASQCTAIIESMIVFIRADPMSRLLMEMVSHSLGSQEVRSLLFASLFASSLIPFSLVVCLCFVSLLLSFLALCGFNCSFNNFEKNSEPLTLLTREG
jgi:serine/threonine protein kinase